MFKNKYHILKDIEILWKSISWISAIFSIASFSIVLIAGLNRYYYFISLAFVYVICICEVIVTNNEKEIIEIKKYIVGSILLLLLATTGFILVMLFTPDAQENLINYIFPWMAICWLIFEILKQTLQKSNNILRYLVTDRPSIFSGEFYRIHGKKMLVAVALEIVGVICIIVLFAIQAIIGKPI
jgi:hypothetical protein